MNSFASSDAALDPEVEALIEQARTRRRAGRLPSRDILVSAAVGGGFVVAAAVFLQLTESARPQELWRAALFVALYAAVARVHFEFGMGATVPTQLVLVPMLFILPLAWVPLVVAAGFVASTPVDLVRGRLTPHRFALLMLSSWHALGPALVLALAGERAPAWSDWPWYAAALAAQFAFDFASNSTRALALGVPMRARLRVYAWVWAVDVALAPVGLVAAFAAVERPILVVLVLPLVGLLAVLARERAQRLDAALELGHAYRGTAMLLGDVVEADDAYTGEHSRDVVSLTLDVADRLGLDAREKRNAEFVALLHDVGKIRIPSEIINKAGPLDPDERRVIETHTLEGEAMLTKVGGLLGQVGKVVRSCHERWDGGGYPDGLAGERIPLIARIVCCTDAYSAMTTDRPYRSARSSAEALAELRRCAGTQFDPRVVDALAAVVSA